MTLTLRKLRLRARTSKEMFGADLQFNSGLNVLQAPNTRGKSTCLQAIIYALGLERMLGPQMEVPLPYVMREKIRPNTNADYQTVIESYVELEIENKAGEHLTIRRDITGGKDIRLMRVWNRVRLTTSDPNGVATDYFVRDPGAAQREAGFHHFLAKFLGIELPLVTKYDGSEAPLYLETIFPMLFVEQKRGWSIIQGPFPTYLGIQDIARRVMEYLLDLDAARLRRVRADLKRQISDVREKWTMQRNELANQIGRTSRLRGIPNNPTTDAADTELSLDVYRGDQWVPIDDAIDDLTKTLAQLLLRDLKNADEAAPGIEAKLQSSKIRYDEIATNLTALRIEHQNQLQDKNSLNERLAALEIDLRRNQDALRLSSFGSDLGRAASEHLCPTCNQEVYGELLPTASTKGMGLEENILFVKSQLQLYKSSFEVTTERLDNLSAQHNSLLQESNDLSSEIRSLSDALLQPSSSPSIAHLEEIVQTKASIERYENIRELADGLIDQLREISLQHIKLNEALKAVPREDLSDEDKSKLAALQDAIQRNLTQFQFRSFKPIEVRLSSDNFRPLVRSVDNGEEIEREIGFEISGSDSVRLKWAYYLSLLQLGIKHHTNHPNLLIFDEPRQQDVQVESLRAFLLNCRQAPSTQQVIIAISEPLTAIQEVLSQRDVNVIKFDEFILQPLN